MDTTTNSPQKTDQASKSDKKPATTTGDTTDKMKSNDNSTKVTPKTTVNKVLKGSVKKRARPVKSKIKSEGLTEASKTLTESNNTPIEVFKAPIDPNKPSTELSKPSTEPSKPSTEPNNPSMEDKHLTKDEPSTEPNKLSTPQSKPSTESKSKPSGGRPMPLSRKHALNQESSSPKPKEEANDGPNATKPPPIKRQKQDFSGNQESLCDPYCWACHREGTTLDCQVCPRSFHLKCDQQGQNPGEEQRDPKNWICKECRAVILAEDTDTRSTAMTMLTIDQLCSLLKFTLNRLKQQALKLLVDSQPDAFNKPVSVEEYPQYLDYVVHPMDLSLIEKNIRKKVYGSTEAFLADLKWMYHNSVIFNGCAHRLTKVAREMVKICRAEMKEIEVCPDCYSHAHTLKDNWFIEPCRKAHVLVWAKLKGFPYWPGKVMQVENGNADIRFFGAHDRAFVSLHHCYLLSYEMPQPLKVKKKAAFDSSLEELDAHIQKLRVKLGGFDYAPVKTTLDPERLYLQPISKVSTGRRHSDADQNSLSKGRTVTIVTSSWMRRLQAEGLAKPKDKKDQKKTPKKSKKGTSSASNSPHTNRILDAKPSDSEMKKEIIESKVKIEDTSSQDKIDQVKKPTPMGVFEISESSSLSLAKPLQLLSPSIVLNKIQTQRPSETAAEKIKRNLMSSMSSGSDVEMETEGVDEDTITSPQGSPAKSTNVPEADKDSATTSQEDNSQPTKEPSPPPQCEVTSTTSLIESEKQIDLATLSADLTPKKTNSFFAQKLQATIQSCKAKLGMKEFSLDEESAVQSTESEGDEEANNHSEDSDKEAETNPPSTVQSKESKDLVEKTSEKAAPKTNPTNNVDSAPKVNNPPGVLSPSRVLSPPRVLSPLRAISPPGDNFSNISSEEGENLVIDETTGDQDNEDSRVLSGTDVEMPDSISKSPIKEKVSSPAPVPRKSVTTKRHSDGSRVSSETASTSLRKPSEVNQRSSASEITQIASRPSSADTQTCNGSNVTENDPSNITNYAHKLIGFMQELCKDAGSPGNPQATIRSLELELEKLRWRHQQELLEVKHNTDLILLEVRASMELDKRKALAELREKLEIDKSRSILELKLEMEKEKQQAVEATKKTQWCANCGKEAIFYCCWNTSYCNHNCQQAHWMSHMNLCTQNQTNLPSVSGVQTNQPNLTILTTNKNMLPTPQLSRPRMASQTSAPVLTGPVQLQYLTGNQCYQLVPTSNINQNNSNIPIMPKSFSGQNQTRPSTQGNLGRN